MNLLDLSGRLSLDSSSYESALKTAEKGAKALTGTILAIGSAISVVAGMAVKFGSEYETAFAKVNTIMDSSQKSTESMSKGILDLSSSMGIASTEIADTVYNVISATGDTANALDIATAASKLAVAGFTDTNSALSVLTTSMNAYGLSAENVTSISDSLLQVQNLGVTTVGELASVMGKAIATGSAYGIDLGNIESAYVSMTKAGINSAESTTYMSGVFNELGDSGSNVGKVLQEQTGLSFSELMEKGYSLGDVLKVLSNSVDGSSSAFINLWGSAEAGKGASAIVGQGLDVFNENLKTITTSIGATDTAFNTMADTFAFKKSVIIETGKNLMSSLYTAMGEQTSQLLTFSENAIAKLATALEADGITGLIPVGGQLTADIVTGIVANAPMFFNSATSLILSFLDSIDQNSELFANSALTLLSAFVQNFYKILPSLANTGIDLVVALVNGIISGIPTFVSNLPDFIEIVSTLIKNGFSKIVTVGKNIIINLVNAIIETVPLLIEQAPFITESLYNALLDTLDMFKDIGKFIGGSIVNGIASWGGSVMKEVSSWFGITSEAFDNSLKLAKKNLTDIGYKIPEATIEGVKQGYSVLPQVIASATDDGVTEGTNAVLPLVAKQGTEIGKTITTAVTKSTNTQLPVLKIEDLVAQFKALQSEVLTSVEDTTPKVKSAWDNAIEGMQNSLKNGIANIISNFSLIGEAIVTGADAWEVFKNAGIQAIANVLMMLGNELAILAIEKAITLNWGAAALALAGSATAYTMAGVVGASVNTGSTSISDVQTTETSQNQAEGVSIFGEEKEQTIVLEVDGEVLGKFAYNSVNRKNKKVGVSMV